MAIRKGRPRKADAPIIPWAEVDRLLVFGEKVKDDKTGHEDTKYPSFRELAERYDVSKALIGKYANKHNCLKRREENKIRTQIQYDQEVIKKCAKARALSTEEELQIIDDYLLGFKKALKENRVRFDNPTDFNTMVRLKEFKQGHADSRQEIQGMLSLEEIQSRHKQLREQLSSLAPALTGSVIDMKEKTKKKGVQSNATAN